MNDSTGSRQADDVWISSGAVAKRLGYTTYTLKRKRMDGKGPKVWKRTSPTTVHYLLSSVIEYENTVTKFDNNFSRQKTG